MVSLALSLVPDVCEHTTRIHLQSLLYTVISSTFKDWWRMKNLRSLQCYLTYDPDTENLFIKSTLGFKRDLNRLSLDETMALALEQYLLNMPSLRFHDLLYGLCLLRRHYFVLCALQELYSFVSVDHARAGYLCLRRSSAHQEGGADILRVIDRAALHVHLWNILHGTAHEFVHIARLELMRSRFRQAGQIGDSV